MMPKNHMPTLSLQEKVSQMRESAQAFLAACEKLTVQQALAAGVCGEWSAKAVVDHLTGWQVQSLPILEQLRSGVDETLDFDIDAFNRNSVESRVCLSWEESLAAFRESFSAFDRAAGAMPTDPDRHHHGFTSWLNAMIHEYRFHLEHIDQAHKLKNPPT